MTEQYYNTIIQTTQPMSRYPTRKTIVFLAGIVSIIVRGMGMRDPSQLQFITSEFLWVLGWHLFQTKYNLWETKMVVLGKCIIWWREGKGMVWHKGILWRRRWYRWSPSISLGQPDRVASRWWINRQTTIATGKGVRLSGKPMFYDFYDKF